MSDKLKPQLWSERSLSETQAVYDDWAASYDADLAGRGYHTPRRLAEALAAHVSPDARPLLDYGCGTGLCGLALRAVGIEPLHGTDINEAMLAEAAPKGIYERLWQTEAGVLDAAPGTYRAIAAAGVISLGAAPASAMDPLIAALRTGDLLGMSFNDPTLEHGGYDAHLQTHLDAGRVELVTRAHGPHLDSENMGADILILKRT